MLEVVKLVKGLDQTFSLRKTHVNFSNVLFIEQDESNTELFHKHPERFPEGLDGRQVFSSISFSGGATTTYLTVVGSPETILSKL